MAQEKILVRNNLSTNTGRGPSENLWYDCPTLDLIVDPNTGHFVRDEFLNVGATTAPYQYVGDASPPFAGLAGDDDYGGIIRAAITNTDNNEAYLASGNDIGTLGAIDTVANGGKKFWFECRIRTSYVTDWGFICGLGGDTICAADLINDNQTAIATSASFVGFRILTAAATKLDAVYLTASGSEVVALEEAGTIAASTWIKLGLKFDPSVGTAGALDWYVNGAKCAVATQVTASTTSVPDGEGLLFVFGAKTGTTAAVNLDCDWWQFAQLA